MALMVWRFAADAVRIRMRVMFRSGYFSPGGLIVAWLPRGWLAGCSSPLALTVGVDEKNWDETSLAQALLSSWFGAPHCSCPAHQPGTGGHPGLVLR